MNKPIILFLLLLTTFTLSAQETLQSVTNSGNTTTNEIIIANDRPTLTLNTTTGNSQIFRFLNNGNNRMDLAYDAAIDQMYLFSYAPNSYFSIYTAQMERFRIGRNGNAFFVNNVGIGVDNPIEKLAVNGSIRAREVKVENANWPDYVFAPDYKILSLSEVDKYIQENKHLPNMPSAKEVGANGIEVSEMLKLQQQKIEELTLYLIEKDKKIDALIKRVEVLEDQKK